MGFKRTNGEGFMPSPFSSGVPRDTIGKRNPSLLVHMAKEWKCVEKPWSIMVNGVILSKTLRACGPSGFGLHSSLYTLGFSTHIPTVHWPVQTVCFKLDITHYTLQTSHYTMYTSHCTLQTAQCTRHSVHCTLHTTHCTLHSWGGLFHWPSWPPTPGTAVG